MAEPRTAWVKGPSDRGTLNIVWSCFSTLALCVWTAVHPNIQLQPTLRHTLQARLLMMITAVIFPEIIISAAWRQLELARWLRDRQRESYRLHTNVANPGQTSHNADLDDTRALLHDAHNTLGPFNDTSKDKSSNAIATSYENPGQDQTSEWNKKQTFFAVMGGFVVETVWVNDEEQHIRQRRSLTAKGVEYLFLADAVPKLSVEDVDERNNTDMFAKAIVVAQIGWFAIQTIARLVAELPLSALEIHTVVHAICALIMYGIWKDKPYALKNGILLDDSRSKKVAALLNCKERLHEVHREQVLHFERAREAYWLNRAVRASQIEKGEISADAEVQPQPRSPRLALLAEVLEFYATADAGTAASPFGKDGHSAENDEHYYDDSIFRSMATDAFPVYTAITKICPEASTDLNDSSWSGLRQTAENFIIRQVWGSWSRDIGHDMDAAKALHFGFNLGYGCLHLAAWNSSVFPTDAEQQIWRISSIAIASVFIWGTAWIAFWKLARTSRSVRAGNWDVVFAPMFGWGMLLFIMARCYLLIESLISLRDSPAAMYKQVAWTTGFPHVS